jgi:hypothetical protein
MVSGGKQQQQQQQQQPRTGAALAAWLSAQARASSASHAPPPSPPAAEPQGGAGSSLHGATALAAGSHFPAPLSQQGGSVAAAPTATATLDPTATAAATTEETATTTTAAATTPAPLWPPPLGVPLLPQAPTYYDGHDEPTSRYLALVPLSDARLRPRSARSLLMLLAACALVAALTVFVSVPRGFEVGSIGVTSPKMSFNASSLTYKIDLVAEIPCYNPNWVSATLEGELSVAYYDAEAGKGLVGPARVAARTRTSGGWNGLISGSSVWGKGGGKGGAGQEGGDDDGGGRGGGDAPPSPSPPPKRRRRWWRRRHPPPVRVHIDASSLPRRYSAILFSACFSFPRELVFFLRGSFNATTALGFKQRLPPIDTYFLLQCTAPKPSPSPSPAPPEPPPMAALRPVVGAVL